VFLKSRKSVGDHEFGSLPALTAFLAFVPPINQNEVNTVGLGDYFIAPEVLEAKDLFIFPPMILVGLAYFAAFLQKLSAALWRPCHNRNENDVNEGPSISTAP